MNRAQRRFTRRARERSAVADLRNRGCTCTPTLTPDQPSPGMLWGFNVRHELGCRLGDAVLLANLTGRVPVLIAYQSRCER